MGGGMDTYTQTLDVCFFACTVCILQIDLDGWMDFDSIAVIFIVQH